MMGFVALALAATVLPALAQNNTAGDNLANNTRNTASGAGQTRITLDQALLLAEQFNPRMAVAEAQIGVARAGILTARAYPNPEANYLAGGQSIRMPTAAGGLLQHWGYSQQIETPAVRRNRARTAGFALEATQSGKQEAVLDLRANVKQAFFEALRQRQQIDLAEESLKLVQDLRQRVQVRVDVGEAGRLELTRAESEVATAQTFVRSAQLRERGALAQLRALVGTALGENLAPTGSLDPRIQLAAFEQVLRQALDRHPALARAAAEVRRAEARLETEKSLRTPQPSVIAEYEQMPDLRFFRAGLSIPVPVFNRRRGPIEEASASLQQATSMLSALRLEISSAVEQAYNTYEIADQQVASFEAGPIRGAQAAVDGAEAAFRYGERGIIEVLDAQRVLRSIRSDYLNAQYDRESAVIELERLRAVDLGSTTP